jgi:uncharacterized membrane protein YhaH (DUF805 family)
MENKVMLMIDALKDGFNRFADFSGVSSRSQYWYFILGTTIATVIAQVAFGDLDAHRPQRHENVIKNLFSLS